MYLNRKALWLLVLVPLGFIFLMTECGPRPTYAPHRALRVLFIGNSYTIYNDLPWITKQLALSAHEARPLETMTSAMMGATLEEHWKDGFALRTLREEGPWDFVVLQEQSERPVENFDAFSNYAGLFDREIKKTGARTILFITWAHRDRAPQQAQITEAYVRVAADLGATLAPVGPAWQSALKLKPDLELNKRDSDSHPTASGSYLAACVFYSMLYGKSPEGLTGSITDKGMLPSAFDPRVPSIKAEPFELNPTDAQLLQRTAWQTFERFPQFK